MRLSYGGLDLHACSSGVFLMENPRFVVVACISYLHLSKKSVLAMGDLVHACCLSLGRCNGPPYLAATYLAKPW